MDRLQYSKAVSKAEGIALGKAQGIAVGKSEGKTEEKLIILTNMIKNNLNDKTISVYTGMSLEEIKELKKQL